MSRCIDVMGVYIYFFLGQKRGGDAHPRYTIHLDAKKAIKSLFLLNCQGVMGSLHLDYTFNTLQKIKMRQMFVLSCYFGIHFRLRQSFLNQHTNLLKYRPFDVMAS